MGEVAEMMLEGTLCASCGVYLGRDNGYPEYCHDCEKENAVAKKAERRAAYIAPVAKVKCPMCGKKVKHNGINDHQRDSHGVVSNV